MPPPDKFSPGGGDLPSSYTVSHREVPQDSELQPDPYEVSSRAYEGLPIDYYVAESLMRMLGMDGLMGDVAGEEVTGADLLENPTLGEQGALLSAKNAANTAPAGLFAKFQQQLAQEAAPPQETGPVEPEPQTKRNTGGGGDTSYKIDKRF